MKTMDRALRLIAVGLGLILILGCASMSKEEQLTKSHRHYERLMGLTEYEIRFQPGGHPEHPDWCGWVGHDVEIGKHGLIWHTPHVVYDPECATTETTLHEACHFRWAHHELAGKMTEEEMEAEVAECMRVYKERERDGR